MRTHHVTKLIHLRLEKLESLAARHIYGLVGVERMYPNYAMFYAATEFGDGQIYRQNSDLIWEALDG
ncbi:DUF416 family protein [Citrobacter freundii]|uniref:DUF416 family protein n=1 Tax=Citrobacter freundii TaxID=546 RepID=UPI00388D68D5